MTIDFIGSDESEPLLGGNDLLQRLGFTTSVQSTPTDSRIIGFGAPAGALDEDDPLPGLFTFFGDHWESTRSSSRRHSCVCPVRSERERDQTPFAASSGQANRATAHGNQCGEGLSR